MKRQHGQKASCDLCDENFETKRDLEIHRKWHLYTSYEYETESNCKKCDFEHTTINTIELHIGKHKVEHFECGLCDVKFEIWTSKLLTRLFSCEIYECDECYYRHKYISNVKEHVKDGHLTANNLHHLEIDVMQV